VPAASPIERHSGSRPLRAGQRRSQHDPGRAPPQRLPDNPAHRRRRGPRPWV